ncbi:MAG: hypothetical protein AVO35_02370 [Candidatus Aegiribacteria sp. MLS_C]|nr:MAG: hypothetical protein AVO35_02370 [Candidatus Aegiribacteria sp. MLS_C]
MYTTDGKGEGTPEERKGERLLGEGSYEKAGEHFLEASTARPEERGRLLHRAAVSFWKAGLYDRAVEVFRNAINEFHRLGDTSGEARNLLGLGASYHGLNRMSEAYKVVHDSLERAESAGDLKTVTAATSWLGIICKDQGDFNLALEHHLKALELSRQTGSDSELSSAMNSLGLTYYHMGDYSRAMEQFREALGIQREQEDSWGLPDTLNSMGMVLRRMGRHQEAMDHYRQALEARKRVGGRARTANVLNNMGNLYAEMGDIDSAIHCHEEALSIRRSISSRSGTASSLLNMGDAYRQDGRLSMAAECLEASLGCQQNNRPDEVMLSTLRMLAQVRHSMGNDEEAYRLGEKALELSAELYREQVDKRLMESREILETEHRVREARLLVSKNRKLQDLSRMLSSQKEQLQLILDYVPAAILFTDGEGTVIRLNRYAAALCGREPRDAVGCSATGILGSLGRTIHQVSGDPEAPPVPILDLEEDIFLEDAPRTFLCHRVPYRDASGEITGTVLFAVDITDRKRAETRRKEIEALSSRNKRLESLGYLAGSIAHDFNNILLGIMGNVELVLGRTTDASDRSNLEKASEGSRRAAALCDQLLAFSGGGNFTLKRLDLSSEVSFILRSMSFDPDMGMQFSMDLAEDLPEIELSPSQLRLTISNLVGVIGERMGDSRQLSVATGRVRADSGYLRSVLHETTAGEGEYLYLDVDGPSPELSTEEFRAMFDPFTTSDVLKTDLRMPAVHGMLRSLGGFITPGEQGAPGFRVRVHFPCAHGSASVTEAYGSGGAPAEEKPAGVRAGGAVLIVDDEDSVRETAEEMLASMGYAVSTCSGGPSALRVLKERGGEIGCMLLDITMPDMSGHEVIREVSALYPDVRVILTSGFAERMVIESRDNPCYRGFLKKPYSMDELREAVEKAIR